MPLFQVAEYVDRLIENDIWLPDGKIRARWFDSGQGAIAFMLDVWVATGELTRGEAERRDAGPGDAELIDDQAVGTKASSDAK